ncbi:MAG: hypothetical protein AAB459_02110 [Patescibacteria group bacterium]
MTGDGFEHRMEALSRIHAGANNPDEPYCGVAALFNADLHTKDPNCAPREEWILLSDFEIQHSPQNNQNENLNWVDPDILEYNGGVADPANKENERKFKEFFETEWLKPRYDHLRERWDKHLNDPDPRARVMGKVALWSYVQYLKIKKN